MNLRICSAVALGLGLVMVAPQHARAGEAAGDAPAVAAADSGRTAVADTANVTGSRPAASLAIADSSAARAEGAAADTILARATPADTAARAAVPVKPRGILVSADHPLVLPGLDAGDADATAAPHRTPGRPGMQDTVTTVRGITVQGERKEVPDRGSATSTHLDRAAIVRFMPSTAADAMVSAPGVELVKTGPWASKVSFRGFDGERVLVMVDGVRLNTGRGHGSNASLVSVDRLDEVELTAGSGGAEYGSDALGGVVNLVTHRPLFAPQRALTLTLGARGYDPGNERAQSGRLKYVSKRIGAELNLGSSRLDRLVTPVGDVANSGSRDDDFGARVALKFGGPSLDLEHTRHAAHDVGLPALNGGFPEISRDASRAELDVPFLASPFGWALPGRAKLLAVDQLYRTALEETNVSERVINRRTYYNHFFDQDHIDTRSQGILPELRFGDNGALRFGGELRREKTSGPRTRTTWTTNAAGDVTAPAAIEAGQNVPDATRDVVAGSVSSRLPVGRVRIETGARYDWMHSYAPNIRLDWAPEVTSLDVVDQRWSLDGGLAVHVGSVEPYGRVASGFRAPNLEDRYFAGPVHGGMYVYGQPLLRPEKSVTYETGIRGDADGWGTFRASVYRTYAENFITLSNPTLVNGAMRFQYANLDRVQIDGLEFSGRARVHGASTTASVTLPRGHDLRDGTFITDVGSAHATLDFTVPVSRWIPSGMLAMRARWSDGVHTDPLKRAQYGAITNPAFWTGNVELGATVFATRVTVGVRNLLNNHYREPISFVDEPGRTYSFAVKRDFQLPTSFSHDNKETRK